MPADRPPMGCGRSQSQEACRCRRGVEVTQPQPQPTRYGVTPIIFNKKNDIADAPLLAIEIAELNEEDLDSLAKKTQLLITSVGPYMFYGEPAVKACANNGTHYVDWQAVEIIFIDNN